MVHNPAAKTTVFHWRTGRAATCLHEIVPESFKGIIQCDGCSAYHAFAQSPQRQGTIRQAGCWAHVRRRFLKPANTPRMPCGSSTASNNSTSSRSNSANPAPGCESDTPCGRNKAAPASKKSTHNSSTGTGATPTRPKSLTGTAISYVLGQWHTLPVFLEDGRVEIDNNLVENTIRPSAIDKKNWLFVGDAAAGDRAAAFYTLLGNCRQLGVDAYAYLLTCSPDSPP